MDPKAKIPNLSPKWRFRSKIFFSTKRRRMIPEMMKIPEFNWPQQRFSKWSMRWLYLIFIICRSWSSLGWSEIFYRLWFLCWRNFVRSLRVIIWRRWPFRIPASSLVNCACDSRSASIRFIRCSAKRFTTVFPRINPRLAKCQNPTPCTLDPKSWTQDFKIFPIFRSSKKLIWKFWNFFAKIFPIFKTWLKKLIPGESFKGI